jgi:phosphohistidine phosphatase SixA
VGAVLSSEYCRTRETADLAFGRAELEPALTGFPERGDPSYDARVRRTKELLARTPAKGENTVLVAHIKNIEEVAGVSIEEGELAVFEPLGGTQYRYLGHIPAGVWPQLAAELEPDS